MDMDRIGVRVAGHMVDARGRFYDIVDVDRDGASKSVVFKRSTLASTRTFRNRLENLGVFLPAEGRTTKSALQQLTTRLGDGLPTVRVSEHLGWLVIEAKEPLFLLDEGYIDQSGWHDTLPFNGPLPAGAPAPGLSAVSDAALWQPGFSGSSWEGYDKPADVPLLADWRPSGSWEAWESWFRQAPRVARTVVSAVLAPIALRDVLPEWSNIVVALVGRRGTLSLMQAAVSPWAGPRAGLFWPDARLQDLERQAARMGELPLAYQEADATSRQKIYDLVQQYANGLTRGRATGSGAALPKFSLRGTLLLESSKPLMEPQTSMQDATLQFTCTTDIETPESFGLAGPQLVEAVLRRSASRLEALREAHEALRQEFKQRRIQMGFEPSRTWRLDTLHAAVELTHRVLVEELGLTGSYEADQGMVTEWREPMRAAGQAEAQRSKPLARS